MAECEILNLKVVGSIPTVRTQKINKRNEKRRR